MFFETENVLLEVIIYMKKIHHADAWYACVPAQPSRNFCMYILLTGNQMFF